MLLTTSEAAEKLDLSLRRVQTMIQTGRLHAQRYGRVWLIEERDLLAAMDRKPGRPRGQNYKPRKPAQRGPQKRLDLEETENDRTTA